MPKMAAKYQLQPSQPTTTTTITTTLISSDPPPYKNAKLGSLFKKKTHQAELTSIDDKIQN